MHIGREKTALKSECMLFPSLASVKKTAAQKEELTEGPNDELPPPLVEPKNSNLSHKDLTELYTNSPLTNNFNVTDGFVSFTTQFKYLDNILDFNLEDDADIS